MARRASPKRTRFEGRDVPPRLLLALAGGLVLMVGIVLLIVTIGFPLANQPYERGPNTGLPPAPRLELAPAHDLTRYRRTQAEADRNIDEAMRATARQGWGKGK